MNVIKRTCVLPKRVIDRNVSQRYWYRKRLTLLRIICFCFFFFSEDQIINQYKAYRETPRGLCIVKYEFDSIRKELIKKRHCCLFQIHDDRRKSTFLWVTLFSCSSRKISMKKCEIFDAFLYFRIKIMFQHIWEYHLTEYQFTIIMIVRRH